MYEICTLIGAILLGFVSDKFYSRRSPIGICSVICGAIASFTMFMSYDKMSTVQFTLCVSTIGFFIGSLHHLICMTCTADLGRQQKSKRATSTITGIVDGIGSSGSGIGQLILGTMIQQYGWRYGFLLVIFFAIILTLIPLGIIFKRELSEIMEIRAKERARA